MIPAIIAGFVGVFFVVNAASTYFRRSRYGMGFRSHCFFAYICFFHFDFLHASAVTKLVNEVINLASIVMLGSRRTLGFAISASNVGRSHLGNRLAIKQGNIFMRKAFLIFVFALILKLSLDTNFFD